MDTLVATLGITSGAKSRVSVMANELDTAVAPSTPAPWRPGPYTFVAADALVLEVRVPGRVVNVHALIAVGVDAEDGAGWLTFWRSLATRGFSGVQPVTSGFHSALVAAIGAPPCLAPRGSPAEPTRPRT